MQGLNSKKTSGRQKYLLKAVSLFCLFFAAASSAANPCKTALSAASESRHKNLAENLSLDALIKQYKGMDGLIRFAEQYFDNDIRKAFDFVKDALREKKLISEKDYKKALPEDLDWQKFEGSLEDFQTLRELYKTLSPDDFLAAALKETNMSRRNIEENMSAVLRAEGMGVRFEKSSELDSLGLEGRRKFSEEVKQAVWKKAFPIEGKDPNKVRQDIHGNEIHLSQYGQIIEKGPYSWEIDHILPVSKGGGDEIDNLQPLARRANRSKGNRREVQE